MQQDDLKLFFSRLQADQKAMFLCLVGHEITIYAREAYPRETGAEDVNKLAVFNEMLHSITSQLRHLLAGDNKRYTDDAFIEIIWNRAIKGSCDNELTWAFQSAMKQVEKG
jgi:hypothetical protein